jgi:hypothetical protein
MQLIRNSKKHICAIWCEGEAGTASLPRGAASTPEAKRSWTQRAERGETEESCIPKNHSILKNRR